MKIFEIIFILLLMLPVALLMRYFVSRLSMQTPKQRWVHTSEEEKKSGIGAWLKRKNQEMDEAVMEDAADASHSGQSPYDDRTGQNRNSASDLQGRTPTSMKRTERIPFAQLYGQDPVKGEVAGSRPQEPASASQRVEERRAQQKTERKKSVRSQQDPSKRQKRKTRARRRQRSRKNQE